MTVTQQLCARISALQFRDLPPEVVAVARQLLLDGIAVGVAGARVEPAPSILDAHCREQGGKAVASVLGLGSRLTPTQAALVNGAAMHVLDFEPMWLPSTHALSPALGAALAAAELAGADGRELATALIKGIEIQGWILASMGDIRSHDLRFHPPGAVGPLGAAVAAAHLLRLDEDQLANAIGIAASRCGGLFTNTGTMTKSSHCGYAAALGLESAMLAARGFTGSTALFDAKAQSYGLGLFNAEQDAGALLSFGTSFRVLEPGYTIKLYPCKFTTHYSVNAGIDAHNALPKGAAIKSVHMRAAVVPSADRPQPRTGLEGKFSVQYCAAAAILDGDVRIATFSDERLNRADMRALLPKVSLEMSPDIPSKYTAGRHLTMDIALESGEHVKTRCDMPRGGWGTPRVTEAEHAAKARDCLSTHLSARDAAECIELANSVERLGSERVVRMLHLASGRPY